jgi:RHS repeat-associated protein
VNRYTSNGLNQYTASGSATLSYDSNGNLSSDGSTSYVYDDENKLVSASGGHSATLSYDPLGRLWQVSSTSTGTTRFYYDGGHIAIEGDGSGNVLRAYVHGDGADQPLVWYEATSGGTSRRFLHRDERGSITAVADQSGNEYAVNAYDEYGIPNSGNQGRFGYTGQAWIGELGMWYYKARFYSPTLGRFMQTDPIGYQGGWNWYNYVANDPINMIDPSGMGCIQLFENHGLLDLNTGVIKWLYSIPLAPLCFSDLPSKSSPSGGSQKGGSGKGDKKKQIVCVGTSFVLAGNPSKVGKQGGFPGVTVAQGSAAIIPHQWVNVPTGKPAGPDMRAIGASAWGIVFHGPHMSDQFQTFQGLTDTVGNKKWDSAAEAQDAIMSKHPDQLVLELVNGDDWRGGNLTILVLPKLGEKCPNGTSEAHVD